MSTVEILRMIEDERRRAERQAELTRLARDARVHRRSLPDRVGRWLWAGHRA
jgi:hypothetical protein